MRDAASDWLELNDPEAHGKSQREYARQMGFPNGSIERDIREREGSFVDGRGGFHCPACYRKDHVRRNTVQ